MINTQEGKWKRHQEYLERGWWNLRHMDSEPYITFEDMVLAMVKTLASGKEIHEAIENSLQLSATDGIFNGKKEKK